MLLLLSTCASASWSFGSFFEGQWNLEREKGDELAFAHYSLKSVGGVLEGCAAATSA